MLRYFTLEFAALSRSDLNVAQRDALVAGHEVHDRDPITGLKSLGHRAILLALHDHRQRRIFGLVRCLLDPSDGDPRVGTRVHLPRATTPGLSMQSMA